MKISLAASKGKPLKKRIRLEDQKPAAVTESVAHLEKPKVKTIVLAPNETRLAQGPNTGPNSSTKIEYTEPTAATLASQIELLPPAPGEKEYEEMPVQDFLAALSQGMGVDYDEILELEPAPTVKKRPARAGIGLKS